MAFHSGQTTCIFLPGQLEELGSFGADLGSREGGGRPAGLGDKGILKGCWLLFPAVCFFHLTLFCPLERTKLVYEEKLAAQISDSKHGK